MKYKWIGKGCLLVRNPEDKKDTTFVEKGSIIPVELSKDRNKQLMDENQIVEFDVDNKKVLKKLNDKLAGQKTGLEKAMKAFSELPDNATNTVKNKAAKKVTDLETKISKTEKEIENLTGGE